MSFKALVIGKSGQVARSLVPALAGRQVLFTSSGGKGDLEMDLGSESSIREGFRLAGKLLGQGGVEVFLAGAMTHVDNCEREREKCERVNHLGPVSVAEECRRLGYGLTFFSTEYVYGGAEYEGGGVGPFSEEDPPQPSSWYGRCKWEAEKGIRNILGDEGALIARTTMVYSWDPGGMNFLMQYLRQLESGDGPFRIPTDQISTPTYAPALAGAVMKLRERKRGGIYHLVGPDLLSRKELVEKVAAAFGFPGQRAKEAFQFVKTADLGQAARRPLTAGLKTDKARAEGLPLVSLQEAFREIRAIKSPPP